MSLVAWTLHKTGQEVDAANGFVKKHVVSLRHLGESALFCSVDVNVRSWSLKIECTLTTYYIF